jgi:hypothetical protein
MTNVELSHLVSEFEESAKQLNTASDSINKIITDLQERFIKANSGLECWIEDPPLHLTEPARVPLTVETDGDLYQWHQIILGFARLSQSEGWCLVTRHQVALQEISYGEDEAGPVSYQYSDPEALWKATHNIRIKALEMMPILVERLKTATEDALKAISMAKKIGLDREILN